MHIVLPVEMHSFIFQIMLCETYLPSFQKCQRIQGQLDLFYAQQIRTYDIDFHDIGKSNLVLFGNYQCKYP